MRRRWVQQDEKPRRLISEKIFKYAAAASGAYVLAIILVMALQLGFESAPIWEEEGLDFIIGTDWNSVPGRESYGALPYVLGTLITSAMALALGFPLSIGIAMLVMIMPKRLGRPLGYLVDLIEAVPSVVFGLWGLFVFRLYFRDHVERPLHDLLGDSIYLFGGTPFGLDVLTASIILAIMIIPTISSISREVMTAVPHQQKEAAYMLGSTTFEMFRMAIFPYSKSGLLGAAILGLGRAVGETMAVTMLIGNATGLNAMVTSFFDAGQTMPSIIANEFLEASPVGLHTSALIGVGLILLGVGLSINVAAHFLVGRMVKVNEGPVH